MTEFRLTYKSDLRSAVLSAGGNVAFAGLAGFVLISFLSIHSEFITWTGRATSKFGRLVETMTGHYWEYSVMMAVCAFLTIVFTWRAYQLIHDHIRKSDPDTFGLAMDRSGVRAPRLEMDLHPESDAEIFARTEWVEGRGVAAAGASRDYRTVPWDSVTDAYVRGGQLYLKFRDVVTDSIITNVTDTEKGPWIEVAPLTVDFLAFDLKDFNESESDIEWALKKFRLVETGESDQRF